MKTLIILVCVSISLVFLGASAVLADSPCTWFCPETPKAIIQPSSIPSSKPVRMEWGKSWVNQTHTLNIVSESSINFEISPDSLAALKKFYSKRVGTIVIVDEPVYPVDWDGSRFFIDIVNVNENLTAVLYANEFAVNDDYTKLFPDGLKMGTIFNAIGNNATFVSFLIADEYALYKKVAAQKGYFSNPIRLLQ